MLDRSGYRRMLLDSRDEEDQERLANIEELITAAKQFAAEDASRTIGDFLENITLASDVDGWDEQQDCVSVMTMHAAKGLEFPVVLHRWRWSRACCRTSAAWPQDEEIEEERRLAFVGMTRAKEELYLCHARLREFRGQTLYAVPSMFLDELPKEGVQDDRPVGQRRRRTRGDRALARRRRGGGAGLERRRRAAATGADPADVRGRLRRRQVRRGDARAPRHLRPGPRRRR